MSYFKERNFSIITVSIMIVFVASLCVTPIASAAQGGLPELEQALEEETAARIEDDATLQQNIDTIELTPGPQGEKGDKGDTGDAGPKGDTGAVGADGAVGTAGATGPKGDTGAAGANGAVGAVGAVGATGPRGDTGAAGADGAVGAAGATGPKGDKGDTGDTSPKGPTGADGADGVIRWDDNTTNLATEMGMQIGNEEIGCDPTTAGTIRFTGTVFEGCDGTAWVLMAEANHDHYEIGDTGPAGGIVFYATNLGRNGLEAAPVDQVVNSSYVWWGCSNRSVGASGIAVGTGAQNTAYILAGCSELYTAAHFADAYTLNGYNDWFLPSKDELLLLYEAWNLNMYYQKWNFANNGGYWSSSESPKVGFIYSAWMLQFTNGLLVSRWKDSSYRVRAIRSF